MISKRIKLEPLNKNDKLDYFNNIANNKHVLETFIDKYVEKYEDFKFDKYLTIPDFYAIKLLDDTFIGVILICERKDNSVEIGYALGEKYWNQGYATEATKLFIEYLLNEKSISKILASAFRENIASQRVMEKAGMKYYCDQLKALNYLGKQRDLIYYSIDKK